MTWRVMTWRASWVWAGWFGLIVTVGLRAGEDRAGDSLVIATYNLQNYTFADRRSEEGFRPAYPKPEQEKAALRAVIRSLDADVLALQEIGGPAFLAELRRDLASEGMVYPYGEAMLAADEARGLAVLSRVPLGAITAHRDLRARGRGVEEAELVRRGMLQAEVRGAGGATRVTLFIVHLKSRLAVDRDDPQAEDQRVAEAQAVRDRILKVFPEPGAPSARFVLLGDFNDLPGSRALEAVEARGKTRIASWTDAADSRGHRWTHAYERLGLYSRFDQVFVSAALEGEVRRAWIADGAEVAGASDHRPLVLELGPGPTAKSVDQ
jgi:endonuclease/exonuclease/phosphatase family metal-dependent hydrolase